MGHRIATGRCGHLGWRYDGKSEVPGQIHSYLSTNFKELRNLPKDDETLSSKAKDRWYVPDPKKNLDVENLRNKGLLEEFWSHLSDGYTPPAHTAGKGHTLPGLRESENLERQKAQGTLHRSRPRRLRTLLPTEGLHHDLGSSRNAPRKRAQRRRAIADDLRHRRNPQRSSRVMSRPHGTFLRTLFLQNVPSARILIHAEWRS